MEQGKRKFNLFVLIGILWGLASPLCLLGAVFFVAFYDKPGGLGVADYLLIASVFAFPLICLIAAMLSIALRSRRQAAGFFALLPLLHLVFLFALVSVPNLLTCGALDCSGANSMQWQGSALSLGECQPPVMDAGDGLTTSGCGALQPFLSAGGKTSSAQEAHNWQFNVQSSAPVRITLEGDQKSCPQARVYDAAGSLLDDFADNQPLCLAGMKVTVFYTFTPPGPGDYIIRVTTPQAPGAYWVKIE